MAEWVYEARTRAGEVQTGIIEAAQPTRLISFEDVRIPAANLLGAEGEGFKFAMQGLDGGRIN